ncbi:choice-of-anchor G family protein [Lacisediminihabitans changchengi]|uniref:Choice-of-anchor G family protein n=1 Tax=Lacisediminihabitans changchengi TaxID=2787634 RepID=A0A934SM01_9MICO|nr:choice-of-anchor G family protein [Lacisediminihabitans changchengi]MBK4349086.1 choice-of-anchor G family protein [Lacisediminihabitans changchengi]
MSHPHSTVRRLRRVGGFITAAALACSGAVLVPLSAQASSVSTTTGSYAQGKFLSGSLAGVNLDDIVALRAAEARNAGSSGTKEVKDPLTASVLRSVVLNSPNGVQLGLGSIIDAGALSQYARAERNGSSLGASGAVGNSGAIGVGATGDGTGGDLTVDLDSLLNSRFASVISDLRLQVQAVAAQASGSTDSVSGKYSLAGLKLNFTSPALASLNDKVSSSLDSATGSLDGLSGPDGALASGVNGLLTGINPVLNAVGSSATVKASVTSDLRTAVQPLLTSTYTTPGITLDLRTGSVVVDLEKLLGGSLNSKAPGTEVLSDAVVTEILNAITTQVASLADQIKNRVSVSLHGAKVDLDITVNALTTTPGTPAVPGKPAVPGLPAIPAIPSVPAVLCNVLDILHLCTPTAGTPAIPGRAAVPAIPAIPGIPAVAGKTLASTAAVHVGGTVDQILAGTASQATASVSLLGGTVNANLNSKAVLGSMAGALTDRLFDGDGALSQVVNSLNSTLVNPAVTALLGPGNTSVQKALAGLLSVKLNVKETRLGGTQGMAVASGTVFTETALRISVLKDLGQSSLATLNLAQASVGPQVAVVVDPGGPTTGPTPPTDNPNDPSDPGTPTTGDNPGGHSTPTAARFSSLASTGVGIATIVAILLALLAAGAYLAREGYRRNHLTEK